MGNTYAKNETENIVNSLVETTVNIGSKNGGQASASNVINAKGCDFSGAKITQQNSIVINLTTFTKNVQSQDADLIYNETVKQLATATAQNLSLNPGSISSENIYRTVTNFSVSLRSNVSSIIQSNAVSINRINCEDSSFKDAVITQKNTSEIITENIIDNQTTQISKQLIEKAIEQTAIAEQKDAMSAFLYAIAAVILAAAVFMVALGFSGTTIISSFTNIIISILLLFIPIIIIGLLSYFVWPLPGKIAQAYGWAPYKTKLDKNGDEIIDKCCTAVPNVKNTYGDKLDYWCSRGCFQADPTLQTKCCETSQNPANPATECKNYMNSTNCDQWMNDVIATCNCDKYQSGACTDYSKKTRLPTPSTDKCCGGCKLTDKSNIQSPNIIGPIAMTLLYLIILGFMAFIVYKRFIKKS